MKILFIKFFNNIFVSAVSTNADTPWEQMGHIQCALDSWRDAYGNKSCDEWHAKGCLLHDNKITDAMIAKTWKDGFHIGHCKQCDCVGHCVNRFKPSVQSIECYGKFRYFWYIFYFWYTCIIS